MDELIDFSGISTKDNLDTCCEEIKFFIDIVGQKRRFVIVLLIFSALEVLPCH